MCEYINMCTYICILYTCTVGSRKSVDSHRDIVEMGEHLLKREELFIGHACRLVDELCARYTLKKKKIQTH